MFLVQYSFSTITYRITIGRRKIILNYHFACETTFHLSCRVDRTLCPLLKELFMTVFH